MNKIILISVFLIINTLGSRLYAQSGVDDNRDNFISATFFNENIALPFSVRQDSPKHPGFTLAFETSRKRSGMYQFTHILQAGYYYHKDFNQVAFISWKPKFELRFKELFNVHAIVGIGYAHSFPVRDTYEFENGAYEKKRNWGKPHATPSLGFGGGIHLDKWLNLPVELFGRYEAFSLAPYALKGKVPVTVNTMLSFGIKCKL